MGLTNKRWLQVHAVIVVLLAAIFAGMYSYVRYAERKNFTCRMDEESVSCGLTMEISKSWNEEAHGYKYGMQYDGVVSNYTSVNLKDWMVELALQDGCYIDSYWNGEVTFENNVLTLKPVDYNNIIEAGGQQTFGFVLYGPSLENVENGRIIFSKQISMTTLPLFWVTILAMAVFFVVDVTAAVAGRKNRVLRKKQQEFLSIINQSFLTFANMIDAKDPYTKGHSHRVAIYSREIARRMGLDEDAQWNLFYIALMHDIGKIGISDAILKKSGKLTPEERAEIEKHVKIGGDILKDFTAIPGIEAGARFHHEKYDGTGYLSGLKGEEISLYARIIGVADAFDAMSSARCYRPKLPTEKIVAELKKCSGTQFDPEIVPYMLQMIEEGAAPLETGEEALQLELRGTP